MDTARRVKYSLMLLILVGAALAMLASTQDWFSLTLVPAAGHSGAVTLQGSAAAPALTALALAGIALAAALAIAGRIGRIVLGVLGILVGVCVLISAISALDDPVGTAASAVTSATGIAGRASVDRLVQSAQTELWGWLAVAGGVIMILASAAVPLTGRLWPDSSRRFQAVRFEQTTAIPDEDGAEVRNAPVTARRSDAPQNSRDVAIDSWDELSRGSDPTEFGGAASVPLPDEPAGESAPDDE